MSIRNFLKPDTIGIHEHTVCPNDDWPEPVRELASCLEAGSPLAVGGDMEYPLDMDDDIERLIRELSRSLKLLRRMDQRWDTVPKTLAVYPFIADLVDKIWQDYRRCHNMALALPVDPCCISYPVDRFHKPYSRVEAVVTTEIPIPRQWPAIDVSPTSSSWVQLSFGDDDGGSGSERMSTEPSCDRDLDNSAHTTDDGESDWVMGTSGDESVQMDSRSQEEEATNANEASQTGSEEDSDSGLFLYNAVFQHLHLVVPQRQGILDFALFCVATPSNAFHVMASSLLQRRALGVNRTLPILVFDAYTTSVQLVFGWTTPANGGSCVDIHIARAAEGSAASSTGIFDLASPLEARSFARSLSRIFSATALAEHEATNSVKDILANQPGDILQWRLDCAGHGERDPSGAKFRDRVECWLGAVRAAELDTTGMAGMMAPNDASSMDKSAGSHCIPPCHRTPTSSFPSSHCTDRFLSEDMAGGSSSKQSSITPSNRRKLQVYSAGALQWQFKERPVTAEKKKLLDDAILLGNLVPPPASKYAQLGPQPHHANLPPGESMNMDRLVITVAYPRDSEEAKLPHLQPLEEVIHYWKPIAMPTQSPPYILNQETYKQFVQHAKMEQCLENFAEAHDTQHEFCVDENVKLHKASSSLQRAFLKVFDTVTEQSERARKHDWNSGSEADGRAVAWDAIHVVCLPNVPDSEEEDGSLPFVRMEQLVRIRRNVAFDLTGIRPGVPTGHSDITDDLQVAHDVSADQNAARTRGQARARRYIELAKTPGPHKGFYSELATAVNKYAVNYRALMSMSLAATSQWVRFFTERNETQYLSRLLEEPTRAKADMVAGIRIPNVLSSDDKASAERIERFSMLVADEPPTKPPKRREVTMSEVFQSGVGQANVPSNPLALRMPDSKDMAELLVSGFEEQPTRSYDPRTSLSSSTTSVMGDNEQSFERQAEFCAEEQHSIDFMIHAVEIKKLLEQSREDWYRQSCHQAYMYLNSGVGTLAAVGIFDFPIFCTASDGPTGLVFAAWATKPVGQDQYIVYIAMHNTPVFDLRKPMHALRFSLFLLHLRFTHAPKLRARFEAVRQSFDERWKRKDKSLDWTLEHQKAEHEDALEKHQKRMENAQILINELSKPPSFLPVAVGKSSATKSSQKSSGTSDVQDASTGRGRRQRSQTSAGEGGPRTRSMSKASRKL